MNPNRTITPTYRDAVVAAIQMVSGPNLPENLAQASYLIDQAAAKKADLVLLPEYFPLIGNSETDKVAMRESFGEGPIQAFLQEKAKKHRLWLIAGSIPLLSSHEEKTTNTTLVFDDSGRCVGRYDKIHLFSFTNENEHYNESTTIEAGTKPTVVETPFGRIGLSICYDIRFPELYRQYSLSEPIALIVVPAAFTHTTGQAHWEVLLRARAIENQCYLLAACQGGIHPNGRKTHGNSMIIDPWGKIIAHHDTGSAVITGKLDHAYIDKIRNQLPALQHRVLH